MNTATLCRAMPGLSTEKARAVLPHLERAMREAKITTVPRAAAFLAQLGHETLSLIYMEEIASGSAYEGRRDLGNTQPGDGRRFKGRGAIMITGRANYTAAGKALKLNLVANPGQVATYRVGFRTAAWYWSTRGLNGLADRGQFDTITQRINGGFNGKADRDARHRRCKALGRAILPAPRYHMPPDEAKVLRRISYHRDGALKAPKGSQLERDHARHREEWKAIGRRQMATIRVAAKRPGGGGWDHRTTKSTYTRGARYHLIEQRVEGR